MSDKYILDGKIPVPCDDLLTWGRWMQFADRHVAKNEIGDLWVSTVFLGLDHQWGNGSPLLFETMIFGDDKWEDYQERCSTWEQAEAQHKRGVQFAENLLKERSGSVADPKPQSPIDKIE